MVYRPRYFVWQQHPPRRLTGFRREGERFELCGSLHLALNAMRCRRHKYRHRCWRSPGRRFVRAMLKNLAPQPVFTPPDTPERNLIDVMRRGTPPGSTVSSQAFPCVPCCLICSGPDQAPIISRHRGDERRGGRASTAATDRAVRTADLLSVGPASVSGVAMPATRH